MPEFLKVGNSYINVERLNRVEVIIAHDGQLHGCVVHFADNGSKSYEQPEAQALADYVRSRKVKE